MKKILLYLGTILMLASPAMAGVNSNTLSPTVFELNKTALTMYVVGGATTTAATYTVWADSITLTTVGGLHPGTTQYVFADTDKDTLGEFIAFLNSVPTTTAGAEGGIVATITEGAYDGNATSELTATAEVDVFGSSKISTLSMDNVRGISYLIPTSRQYRGYQFHVTGLNANATYTSGSVILKAYDGDKSTDTEILRYKMNATTAETPIVLPSNGDFVGSNEKAMRFDVIGSSWVTAGYIGIIGNRK
jgi:hypothetical protein